MRERRGGREKPQKNYLRISLARSKKKSSVILWRDRIDDSSPLGPVCARSRDMVRTERRGVRQRRQRRVSYEQRTAPRSGLGKRIIVMRGEDERVPNWKLVDGRIESRPKTHAKTNVGIDNEQNETKRNGIMKWNFGRMGDWVSGVREFQITGVGMP